MIRKSLGLALLLLSCTASAVTTGRGGDDPPLGLWVFSVEATRNDFVLTIERTGDRWLAAVDGESTPIEVDGTRVTVRGPAGQSFDGQRAEDGQRIDGYWEQPATTLAYSRIVTKMILERVAPDRWRGEVSAQPRPFAVFLDIFKTDRDGVAAVIRNPERNEILASRFRLEAEGQDRWGLFAGRGENQLRVELHRHGIAELRLFHPWFGDAILLRPATARDAQRYFPRAPAPTYRHVPPAQTGDGWSVIGSDEPGVDRGILNALVQALATEDPRSRRPRLVHSMVVAYRGRLLFEEYFYGHDRNSRHDTRSMAKVFGPIMIGALRQQGSDIDPEDTPVADVLAGAGEAPSDPRKREITLGHLMSYSSGLDCDGVRPSQGSEDAMWSQKREANLWRFTARLPLIYDPGTRYAYCSGSINMAAASITAKSGLPLYETFDRLIAEPLNFGTYHWNLAPNGEGYLAGGVYMSPRDILKLGVLYTAGGTWHGRRILSADWITESTAPRIPISPETTRLSQSEFDDNYWGGEQAYVWRRDVVKAGDTTYASYEATGNGGQILLVVPDLELAVVLTGGNYRWGSIWGRWRDELVGTYVIPAIRSSP
ncbi:MAG: serine hydrolase domain-containing protein [Myxococcota bacterium]